MVVPPRPQATASVRKLFFSWKWLCYCLVILSATDSTMLKLSIPEFSDFLSIFLGARPNFWSLRVKYGQEIFYAAQIMLCKTWMHAINLSGQFLTNSGVTQKVCRVRLSATVAPEGDHLDTVRVNDHRWGKRGMNLDALEAVKRISGLCDPMQTAYLYR